MFSEFNARFPDGELAPYASESAAMPGCGPPASAREPKPQNLTSTPVAPEAKDPLRLQLREYQPTAHESYELCSPYVGAARHPKQSDRRCWR